MTKKNGIKLILDSIMLVILMLSYQKNSISMAFHEWAGLALFAMLVLHLLLNWRWVLVVTTKLFSKELPTRTRVGYLINFLLLCSFGAIAISGIMISKVVFSFGTMGFAWKTVHYFASACSILLMGVHLGLHGDFICGMLRKLVPIPIKIGTTLALGCSVVIVAYGCYSVAESSFLRWITMPFMTYEVGGLSANHSQPSQQGEAPRNQGEITSEDGTTGNITEPTDQERPNQGKGNRQQGGNRPDKGNNEQPFGEGNHLREDGNFPQGLGKGQGYGKSSPNPFGVFATYFSITYLFAVLTYGFSILIDKRRRLPKPF